MTWFTIRSCWSVHSFGCVLLGVMVGALINNTNEKQMQKEAYFKASWEITLALTNFFRTDLWEHKDHAHGPPHFQHLIQFDNQQNFSHKLQYCHPFKASVVPRGRDAFFNMLSKFNIFWVSDTAPLVIPQENRWDFWSHSHKRRLICAASIINKHLGAHTHPLQQTTFLLSFSLEMFPNNKIYATRASFILVPKKERNCTFQVKTIYFLFYYSFAAPVL